MGWYPFSNWVKDNSIVFQNDANQWWVWAERVLSQVESSWRILFLNWNRAYIFLSILDPTIKFQFWGQVCLEYGPLSLGLCWITAISLPKVKTTNAKGQKIHTLMCKRQIVWVKPMHRGAFCQFPFWWIYYYGSNKSTGKETGKTHNCAMADKPKSVKLKNAFFWEDFNPLWLREDILSSWTIAHDTPTYILENNRSAELLSDANIWKYFSPVSIF